MTRREALEKKLEILANMLGTKLELSTWAPGDGWRRYQVMETQDGLHPGRELFGTWKVYNIREVETAVNAALYALEFKDIRPYRFNTGDYAN